jgi:putative transposase
MKYDADKQHRRAIRLRGYDYAQGGAYFVTTVTKDRACLFGEIVDGEMRTNQFGRIVQTEWDELPDHYPGVERYAFMVMPNHVHGIIALVDDGGGVRPDDVGAGFKPARTGTPHTAPRAGLKPAPPHRPNYTIASTVRWLSSRRTNP